MDNRDYHRIMVRIYGAPRRAQLGFVGAGGRFICSGCLNDCFRPGIRVEYSVFGTRTLVPSDKMGGHLSPAGWHHWLAADNESAPAAFTGLEIVRYGIGPIKPESRNCR